MTPKTAGASPLAVNLAKRVLSYDGMALVRNALATPRGGYDLEAFCADIARDIDSELRSAGIHQPSTTVAADDDLDDGDIDIVVGSMDNFWAG